MRYLIAVVAVSFAAALYVVPASPSLSPAHITAADCFWCVPDAGPPPPRGAEEPPVGGSDGCTIGDDCTYVDGPGTGPNPGVITECGWLDGETCLGDQGDGAEVECLPWCVVYYAPNDAPSDDSAPAADPPAPVEATYGCGFDYCDLAKARR